MTNSQQSPIEQQCNPTIPHKVNMDELARLWIELVLRQVEKAPVVLLKRSSYNLLIDNL